MVKISLSPSYTVTTKGTAMEEELLNRIVIDSNILAGKPVIKGTRIPVYLIIELLANGLTPKQILKEYPELKQEDIKAALLYASKLLEREITVTL
jgi:uncharacterized protein (DUF433 family)